jgi:putative nucleotidyltransferase with HDIG domain
MIAVADILAQIGALPPLPGTAVRLMKAVSDPRSRVEDIVEAIRYDQALTTQVLRLCNSAYFGLSRQITSLNEAMVCLGTVKVLQLVMAVHTNSMLNRPQSGYGLEVGVLWKHSVAVALAASLFAQRIKLTNVNLVFTAGLLHDIGKVVLSQHVAGQFSEILQRVGQQGQDFIQAEREVLGFSHDEIGAQIAEKWSLPEPIVRCIRYHHDPGMADPPDALVDVVYLANSVCLLLGVGLGADGLSYRANPTVMERTKLAERDLEAVGMQMLIELQNVEAMFDERVPQRQ